MAKRFHLFITLELRQTLNAMYIRFSAKYAKQSISRGCLLESLTQTVSNSFLVIVDSGNPFITLLGKIADNINRLFDPSAVLVEGSPQQKSNSISQQPGAYGVDCDATVPKFGIILGNHHLYHHTPYELRIR